MGIIWTVLLVFAACMVIQYFDIKQNVRKDPEDKKKKSDKKEQPKNEEKSD